MSCAPCSSDRAVRAFLSRKLGRCRSCLRSARIGTLTAWAIAVALLVLDVRPFVTGAALGLAGLFSVLLLAHAVAYAVRAARSLPAAAAERGGGLDRHGFLAVVLGAAIIGATGWRAGKAKGQPPPRDPPPDREDCHCVIPDDALFLKQSGDRKKNEEWEVCVNLTKVGCFGTCPEATPGQCVAEVTCKWDRKATKATGGKLRFPKKKNKKGAEEDECCVVVTAVKCPVAVHAEVEVTVQCFCGEVKVGEPCKKTLTGDFTIECCCPPRFDTGIKREGDVPGGGIPGFNPAVQRAVLFSAPAVPKDATCSGGCTSGGLSGKCETKVECQWSVSGERNSTIVGDGKDCLRVVVVFDMQVEAGKPKHFMVTRSVKITCSCLGTDNATCFYDSTFKGP